MIRKQNPFSCFPHSEQIHAIAEAEIEGLLGRDRTGAAMNLPFRLHFIKAEFLCCVQKTDPGIFVLIASFGRDFAVNPDYRKIQHLKGILGGSKGSAPGAHGQEEQEKNRNGSAKDGILHRSPPIVSSICSNEMSPGCEMITVL